jgi:hypothetical protein
LLSLNISWNQAVIFCKGLSMYSVAAAILVNFKLSYILQLHILLGEYVSFWCYIDFLIH